MSILNEEGIDHKDVVNLSGRLSRVEATQAVQGSDLSNIKEITSSIQHEISSVKTAIGELKTLLASATVPKPNWIPVAGLILSFVTAIFGTIGIMIVFITNPIEEKIASEIQNRNTASIADEIVEVREHRHLLDELAKHVVVDDSLRKASEDRTNNVLAILNNKLDNNSEKLYGINRQAGSLKAEDSNLKQLIENIDARGSRKWIKDD